MVILFDLGGVFVPDSTEALNHEMAEYAGMTVCLNTCPTMSLRQLFEKFELLLFQFSPFGSSGHDALGKGTTVFCAGPNG